MHALTSARPAPNIAELRESVDLNTRGGKRGRARWTLARDQAELRLMLSGMLLVLLVLTFVRLAGLVLSGSTRQFDEQVLMAFRDPANPSVPIGPDWLHAAALDITALGSGWVLGLVVFSIVGFLAFQGLHRTALFVLLATTSGSLLNTGLKELFGRARPEIVPHLREVFSLSFPSGHAMTSAAVYLTLGALLMRISENRTTKLYCMTVAMLLTVMVGSTRVYLGVHYPTDVLAGWLAGMSWALICWLVERVLERRTRIGQERL